MSDEDDLFDGSGPRTIMPMSHVDSWAEGKTTEASIELLLPARQSRPPMFHQVTGPGAPSECHFVRDSVVVGRSKAADISIDSPELSRRHCVIEREGQEWTIFDLESRNGVYLNGLRIHSAVLRPGDAVQIGNVMFVFHEAG